MLQICQSGFVELTDTAGSKSGRQPWSELAAGSTTDVTKAAALYFLGGHKHHFPGSRTSPFKAEQHTLTTTVKQLKQQQSQDSSPSTSNTVYSTCSPTVSVALSGVL